MCELFRGLMDMYSIYRPFGGFNDLAPAGPLFETKKVLTHGFSRKRVQLSEVICSFRKLFLFLPKQGLMAVSYGPLMPANSRPRRTGFSCPEAPMITDQKAGIAAPLATLTAVPAVSEWGDRSEMMRRPGIAWDARSTGTEWLEHGSVVPGSGLPM